MCRREIDWYRRRRGAERIDWVDVSLKTGSVVTPGLCTSQALARFYVRLPDGRLVSGGAAFAELWFHLPGLRRIGRIFRSRMMSPLLERAYVAFLPLRPYLQRMLRSRRTDGVSYPRWLERDLRSDHAGETGAVAIYRGILAFSKAPAVRDFAARHLEAEARHLKVMDSLLPASQRSRLTPLWRAVGYFTGALPALLGPHAVYATVDAVESFVDRHYAEQINALIGRPQWDRLRSQLEQCRRDELAHRDEARDCMPSRRGAFTRLWCRAVAAGSVAGVALARRF